MSNFLFYNSEKSLLQKGFMPNVTEKRNLYCEDNLELSFDVVTQYKKGSDLWTVWNDPDISEYVGERAGLLVKLPLPSLTELWQLYIKTPLRSDDHVGALIFLNTQYKKDLVNLYSSLLTDTAIRKIKKACLKKELGKYL